MKRRVHITDEAAADLVELAALGYELHEDYRHARELLEQGQPLIGFDHHPLEGQLAGWYAFAIGVQTSESAPRVVYYERGWNLWIVAAGEHGMAYERARKRRAMQAARASRRKKKLRRLR